MEHWCEVHTFQSFRLHLFRTADLPKVVFNGGKRGVAVGMGKTPTRKQLALFATLLPYSCRALRQADRLLD